MVCSLTIGKRLSQIVFAGVVVCVAVEGFSAEQKVSMMLEEVVVTARKVEENLQTTPVAVSAYTGKELEVRGALDVIDIGSATPNVNLSTGAAFSGLSSAPAVYIRGIGQSDFVNTSDPAVGIYVDGVYVARSIGGILDLLDVERAEVLRGPQGTLFGRNSIGGAIDLITKRPDPDGGFNGKMALTLGEDNHYEGQVSTNIPISNNVAARVAALYRQRDGFIDATQYDDLTLGGDDALSMRGQLRIIPIEFFTVDLVFDYTREREAPAPTIATSIGAVPGTSAVSPDANRHNTVLFPQCATADAQATNPQCVGPVHLSRNGFTNNSVWTDANGNRVDPEQELDIWGVNATMVWEMQVGILKSITAYREMESMFFNDIDFTPFNIFQNVNETFDQEQLSQEFQFTGLFFEDSLSYVAGIYYFEEDVTEVVALAREAGPGNPPASGGLFLRDERLVTNESLAFYNQATYDFSESFHLTVGLRYTKEDKEFSLGNFIFPISRQSGPQPGFQESKEWTPLLTLGWNVSDAVYSYFTYSEGFRSGGFTARTTGAFATIPPFDPEFVKSYELGLKMDVLDNRLRLNMAAFQTAYDDIQIAAVQVIGGENNTGIDNLANATLNGLELEAIAVLSESLRLDVSFGWLDDSIDQVAGGLLRSAGVDITTDNELPYTPDMNWNVGLTHLLSLSSSGEIQTRLDWRYVDEQFFRIENIDLTKGDSYSVVNASITYRPASEVWEVGVNIRNLLDEEYITNGTFSGLGTSSQATVGRPRTVSATVRYFWDK